MISPYKSRELASLILNKTRINTFGPLSQFWKINNKQISLIGLSIFLGSGVLYKVGWEKQGSRSFWVKHSLGCVTSTWLTLSHVILEEFLLENLTGMWKLGCDISKLGRMKLFTMRSWCNNMMRNRHLGGIGAWKRHPGGIRAWKRHPGGIGAWKRHLGGIGVWNRHPGGLAIIYKMPREGPMVTVKKWLAQ